MNKITLKIVLLICGFLIPVSAFIYLVRFEAYFLKNQLMWLSPLFLEINMFLLVAAFIINFSYINTILNKISRKSKILLLILMVGSVVTTSVIAPKTHRIYYDEDIYLNIAQNIANLKQSAMCNEGGEEYGEYFCNNLEYNKEPNGWPYLLSLVFRITGSSHFSAFLANNIIWALTVPLVFLIGNLLFNNEIVGLFGAFIFTLIPEGIKWSNTTSAETSAMFFAGLAFLAVVLYIKKSDFHTLFFLVVSVPFSVQFRPESGLIFIPIILLFLFSAKRQFKHLNTYLFFLLSLWLVFPHLIHLVAVSNQNWGAVNTSKFDWAYFSQNISVNGLFYIINQRFPVLFTFFAMIGLISTAKSDNLIPVANSDSNLKYSHYIKEKCILLIWFLLFWGIFLFFYAGSYNFGADVRFSLLSYIPLSIFSGLGAIRLGKMLKGKLQIGMPILIALILISFLQFLPYIKAETSEAWAARKDHQFARKMADILPDHSLILTHNPNMFLLWERNSIQTSIVLSSKDYYHFLKKKYYGGIYFHYNYWCNVNDPAQVKFCNNVLKNYKTRKIIEFKEHQYKYILYQLIDTIN
jgi:hypothetical protein